MKKPKIIFFDIDGTLVEFEKPTVSKNTLKALHRLKEEGIKIVIATGRAHLILPEIDCEFDAFLTYNGSYCYDDKGVIFQNSLHKGDVKKIIKNARELNKWVLVGTDVRFATTGYDENLQKFSDWSGVPINETEDFEKVFDESMIQLVVGAGSSHSDKLMEGIEHLEVAAWWDDTVDIIPKNAGKGYGVQKMLEYFGIDKKDSMAFGDGENDLSLFEAVGTSVAMANAVDSLKEIADYICPDVKDDGIYYYLLDSKII